VFLYGGMLVRLERQEHGQLVTVPLTVDRLRHHIARIATWYVVRGKRPAPAYPPVPVVRDLLAQPDPPVPVLERIVSVPIIDRDGVAHVEPGYVGRPGADRPGSGAVGRAGE
jgi:hypothetical protein